MPSKSKTFKSKGKNDVKKTPTSAAAAKGKKRGPKMKNNQIYPLPGVEPPAAIDYMTFTAQVIPPGASLKKAVE